jgi:hypothetical protein
MTATVSVQTKEQRLDAIFAEAERLDRTKSWTQEAFDRLLLELTVLKPGEDLEPFLVLVPADFTDGWMKRTFDASKGKVLKNR